MPKRTAILWNWCNTPNALVVAQGAGIALLDGWRVQGRNMRYFNDGDTEPSASLALLCGWRGIRRQVGLGHIKNGTPVLIHDLGYLNRFGADYSSPIHHYQVGLNGLCWLPPAAAVDASRFDLLGLKLVDYRRRPGDDILILGQVPKDGQHELSEAELIAWYTEKAAAIRAVSERRIVFRPHPKTPDMALSCADEQQSPKMPLPEAFKTCHCVVTYNSTGGTEALLHAVPVICDPSAMYAEYCDTDASGIGNPAKADRREYFARLSFAQWKIGECRSGECFRFMEPFVKESRGLLQHT